MTEIINVLLRDNTLQVIILGFLLLNQNLLLPFFMGWFQRKIKYAVDKRLAEIGEKDVDAAKEIKKKFGSEEYIDYRTRELGFITKIIGSLEIIFFATFAYIADEPMAFLTALGVWLGIKTAVNYGQWNHVIAGKAYFYTSLIGTLINIGLPVLIILFLK